MDLHIELLRRSFNLIRPIALQFTTEFFQRFIKKSPEIETLFEDVDWEKQQKLFFDALIFVINNLENKEALTELLETLGRQHINYGVKPHHYGLLSEALLETFLHFFQEKWTAELNQQWLLLISFIMSTMKKGASQNSIIQKS